MRPESRFLTASFCVDSIKFNPRTLNSIGWSGIFVVPTVAARSRAWLRRQEYRSGNWNGGF
jgi:hypothetical protein